MLFVGGEDLQGECWGDNEYGQLEVPGGELKHISTGPGYTCFVAANGDADCIGYDELGACDVPDSKMDRIGAGGYFHVCGLSESGAVLCWGCQEGGYDWGQCDAPQGEFHEVCTGAYHSCALKEDGEMVCWGDRPNADLGQTDVPSGEYRRISCGGVHSCGITTAGDVRCWGGNDSGQLFES